MDETSLIFLTTAQAVNPQLPVPTRLWGPWREEAEDASSFFPKWVKLQFPPKKKRENEEKNEEEDSSLLQFFMTYLFAIV